jgi:hypothetical protein
LKKNFYLSDLLCSEILLNDCLVEGKISCNQLPQMQQTSNGGQVTFTAVGQPPQFQSGGQVNGHTSNGQSGVSDDIQAISTGDYYTPFQWGKGFENWDTVRIATLGDGSCLFHGVINGFWTPYHTGILYGQPVSRKAIVKSLRNEMAAKLAQPVNPLDPNSPILYNILANGRMAEFAKEVPELTIENMQKILASDEPIGFGYLEYLSNIVDKDIVVLEYAKQDVYVTGDDTLFRNRNTVVILSLGDHYELVGLLNQDRTVTTYFEPSHPFILFLRGRYPIPKP